MRAAVVRDSDGLVTNVIEVPDLLFPVETGHALVESDEAGPGWTWDGTVFRAPPPPPPPPTPAELLDAEIARAPFVRALVEELAARFGTTKAALITALKARL